MRKEAGDALALKESDLCRIPARQRESNKGTYGPLLCIVGSEGMTGAAYLTAFDAYRNDAGLVRTLTPEVSRPVLQIQLSKAIVESYDLETKAVTVGSPGRQFLVQQQGSTTISEEGEPAGQAKSQRLPSPLVRLEELLVSSKAVVIGPGLGQSEAAVALTKETLSRCEVPLMIDADAPNPIARRPSLLSCRKSNWISTSYPSEMSRLTEREIPEILCESRAITTAYRDHYGVTVCLKTPESIIAAAGSRKIYRSESGMPALTKTGNDNVLSGVIAGLLCLGMEPGTAAVYGIYLHGRTRQAAAGQFSLHGTPAWNTADAVSTVIRSVQTIELEDMGEERVEVQQEEKEKRRVYAKISKAAFCHNVEVIQASLPVDIKMAGVAKMDGCGHSTASVCEVIMPYVTSYCVAATEEALELRGKGIEKPILVLGPVPGNDYASLIRAEIRLSTFTGGQAASLSIAVAALGIRTSFHLVVDTGINRTGLRADEVSIALAEKITAYPTPDFEGMLIHFYRTDEQDPEITERQMARLRNFKMALVEKGLKPRIYHVVNSAGILNLHGTNSNMVRADVALYGIYLAEEMAHMVRLKPVLSLRSTVTYVKEMPAGEAISYGSTYAAASAKWVTTMPVGYDDGRPCSLSNKGEVSIHGKRCRILGRICMDQFMIDVNKVREAAPGSPVTLLDADGSEHVTPEELAERSGRFPCEPMCYLNRRVLRIYC